MRFHIEEGPQSLDRSAGHRLRQRLHPGCATKSYRWIVDHSPTGGIDLHRPPGFIAKIEIQSIVQSTDADMHLPFGRIETRLGLDHINCRLQRLVTRRALSRHIEAMRQPFTKTLRADRPGFAM